MGTLLPKAYNLLLKIIIMSSLGGLLPNYEIPEWLVHKVILNENTLSKSMKS